VFLFSKVVSRAGVITWFLLAASTSLHTLASKPKYSSEWSQKISSVSYPLPEYSSARIDLAPATESFRYMYKVNDRKAKNLHGKVEMQDGVKGNVDGEYRGAIHQFSRIILNSDSKRDS
jgi:hypothetical protein